MPQTTSLLLLNRGMEKLYGRYMDDIRRDFSLSRIEITIISFLHNNPGLDTAADIAELRMLSKGAVSKAVEVLVQRSLLERIPDGKDRRKIHLRLKPEANPITENIDEVREEFLDTILEGFSKEEVEMQVSLNQRLFENTMRAMEGREKS